MKQIVTHILGWIAAVAGMVFLVVTVLLLVGGKFDVAGIFIIPTAALLLAGANLLAYSRRKTSSDKSRLSKG